ncbi:subclass B3 metallo-beta-lactamase [Altererythrobacter soli]|uniref:Subclass B3 metallo-beta-lactamase n=1 Tax=Croceibacterium soli TaxID=1739690 RepID=A0A6I4USZ2_9SPHN|nr:subclass B3 metallo-beta-lactamase [Croceibacterium soli]
MSGECRHHPLAPSSKEEGECVAPGGSPLLFRGGGLGVVAALAVLSACTATQALPPEQSAAGVTPAQWAAQCADDSGWDEPGPPFQVHGNTWYVGTCGIAAILVTSDEGHVLIDGGTGKGAAPIAANIEALGFALTDVKLLLHSHEHFDHVGGLAELQRRTGARLLASQAAAPVLASGQSADDDPQKGALDPFAPIRVDGTVKDGEVVRVGDLALTAIATPGHTTGALSWQWRSCDEAGQCETVVYGDSLSPVSADSYRFSNHPARLAAYRASLKRFAGLDCTLLLTPHPSASGMRDRILGGDLTNSAACANYAAAIGKRLDQRLAKETNG